MSGELPPPEDEELELRLEMSIQHLEKLRHPDLQHLVEATEHLQSIGVFSLAQTVELFTTVEYGASNYAQDIEDLHA